MLFRKRILENMRAAYCRCLEKYGSTGYSTRSCLGLAFILTILGHQHLRGEVLLEKNNFVSSEIFNYSSLNSVSFFCFSSEKWKINLKPILDKIVDNKIKVLTTGADSIEADALLSKVNFYIDLSKIEKGTFLLSMNAMVDSKTSNGFRGKIPVFGRTYIIKTGKAVQKEIDEQVTQCLHEFVIEYSKSNSQDLARSHFFVVN